VNKPGANGRVSYNTLSHSSHYSRDREKKYQDTIKDHNAKTKDIRYRGVNEWDG